MTQPAKSQEPSMEEILASIRRIIADDDASKSAQRATEAPKAVAPSPPPAAPPPEPAPRIALAEPSPAAVMIEEAAPELDAATVDVAAPAVEEDQSADILELTESMAAPAPPEPAPAPSVFVPTPQFRTIVGGADVSFDEPSERPARDVGGRRGDDREQLLSNATSAAVDSAFNTLAQTVLVQNARTLEDLVREMLRPLLKSWLDDNLPGLVERLVRAEIERVSRAR
jgi:uncharacterized protein